MGSRPYKIIESLKLPDNGVILEIGSERNDGSTTYLNNFAALHNKPFYTVDFDIERYEGALCITKGRGAYHMIGERFLSNIFPLLNQKIAFAYLDNFDLVTTDGRNWDRRIALYKSYGLDMNNTNSQIAHMVQSLLIEKYTTKQSYILFDDTWKDTTGQYMGKGALAIRYLEYAGYKIKNDVFCGSEVDGLKNGYVLMERT